MSTFQSLNYHIVFSTKERRPWIHSDWINSLHRYMGGAARGLGAAPLKVGGVADHVHLLIGCKTIHRPCDFVRELKKSASQWVHQEIGYERFRWQDGYAIFSVSPQACAVVSVYIANQAEHHRQRGFREELVQMLKRAGVEYDDRYLR